MGPWVPVGTGSPRWFQAAGVATRPRGVRASSPARTSCSSRALARGPDEERLGDLLDGLHLLADGDREGADADRPAAEPAHQRVQHGSVEPVQPQFVHVVDGQRGTGDLLGDHPVGPDLGVVAHPAEQPIGDPRCAPGPTGDLHRAVRPDVHGEQLGRPGEHLL